MDRFNELERLWEERQKKRKLALMFMGGAALAGLAVYLVLPLSAPLPTPKAPEPAQTVAEKTVPAVPQPEKETKTALKTEPAPPPPAPPVTPSKPKLKDPRAITLDLSFREEIDGAINAYRQKHRQPAQPHSDAQEIQTPPQADSTGDEGTLRIKSETVDDSEKIALLIDNYEFDETYENAMKIARHYFASETYPEAIKWALTANQLDSADDESWLIFAKASIAVGDNDQAKKALQTYLLKRDSLRIRQLYQSIK